MQGILVHKENIPVNQIFISGPKQRASGSKLRERKNLFLCPGTAFVYKGRVVELAILKFHEFPDINYQSSTPK